MTGERPVRHVFTLQVTDAGRLRQLNEQYRPALARAAAGIPGLIGIEKYLLGDQYVEVIELTGSFGDFARQLAADPEVREFLRAVGACFAQSLRDLPAREMSLLQSVPGPATEKESR